MLAEILGPDILVIFVIIGLLFGSSQIPKLARSLGSAKREFEAGIRHEPEPDPPAAAAPAAVAPAAVTPAAQVTMTKADLEALLAEREQAARRESSPPRQPD